MSTPSKWPYFSTEELRCSHCGECHMNDQFMQKIVSLRRQLGFPFIVTSGYRCPDYNDNIAATGRDGPHTTGRAIDIHVTGNEAYKLIAASRDVGITGVGVSQKGSYDSRFIHLDDLKSSGNRIRPHLWSY